MHVVMWMITLRPSMNSVKKYFKFSCGIFFSGRTHNIELRTIVCWKIRQVQSFFFIHDFLNSISNILKTNLFPSKPTKLRLGII